MSIVSNRTYYFGLNLFGVSDCFNMGLSWIILQYYMFFHYACKLCKYVGQIRYSDNQHIFSIKYF